MAHGRPGPGRGEAFVLGWHVFLNVRVMQRTLRTYLAHLPFPPSLLTVSPAPLTVSPAPCFWMLALSRFPLWFLAVAWHRPLAWAQRPMLAGPVLDNAPGPLARAEKARARWAGFA